MLEQDIESAWLELDPAEDTDTMPQILGSSVSHRIAIGPQQGRKAFMIRTVRPLDRPDSGLERVAKADSPTVFDSKRAKRWRRRSILPPRNGGSAKVTVAAVTLYFLPSIIFEFIRGHRKTFSIMWINTRRLGYLGKIIQAYIVTHKHNIVANMVGSNQSITLRLR